MTGTTGNRDGTVNVMCWCQTDMIRVPADDIWNLETGTCGRACCNRETWTAHTRSTTLGDTTSEPAIASTIPARDRNPMEVPMSPDCNTRVNRARKARR